MTPVDIRLRLFLVGVPRSGTTLVQSLLASHSQVTSFTESHLFARHFTRLPGLAEPLLTRNPAPRVAEFLAENDLPPGEAARWFAGQGRGILRLRPLLPLQTRLVARRLLSLLDEMAVARRASSWLEKTPRHLRYLRFLEGVAAGGPPVRFLHVVRDGLATTASLHRASQSWERPYDLDTCIDRWNREVATSLRRLDSPIDHFVLYEEMTRQPETTLRRLLSELGLPWEPEILRRYGDTAEGLITGQEAWKADVGRRLQPSAAAVETLSPDQRDRVTGKIQSHLYQELADRLARRSATQPRHDEL